MPTVEKFSHEMVEKVLKAHNWKYFVDNDGDFRVDFAYDEDTGCEVGFYCIITGSKKQIYSVRVHSSTRIKKTDWDRVLFLCNTWNETKRWPKAYLHVRDREKDSTGVVYLEEQIDLEPGIHQELLDDFTVTVFTGGNSF